MSNRPVRLGSIVDDLIKRLKEQNEKNQARLKECRLIKERKKQGAG